jgi:hypothetical protein
MGSALDARVAKFLSLFIRDATSLGKWPAILSFLLIAVVMAGLFALYLYRKKRAASETLTPLEAYDRQGDAFSLDRFLESGGWYFLLFSMVALIRAVMLL